MGMGQGRQDKVDSKDNMGVRKRKDLQLSLGLNLQQMVIMQDQKIADLDFDENGHGDDKDTNYFPPSISMSFYGVSFLHSYCMGESI